MNKDVKIAKDFLTKYKMNPNLISIDILCSLFIEEMNKGLRGDQSSLMMIPTYIKTEKEIPLTKPVIVLDAGGTNFRVATVIFKKNGITEISKFRKFKMPGTENKGNVGKDDFFNRIADFIKESVNDSDSIGFCFSYPTEIFPNGDGKLIHFVKEVKAPEVEGSMIGENLLDSLNKKGFNKNKKIVILNDTVATLLAGKSQKKNYDSYIGFILGTGTNCSYIEKNSNIKKINNLDKHLSQAINMESGQFNVYPGGILDSEFRASTDKPEEGVFEKMISGAYQGPLALMVLKKAAADGLFSDNFKTDILKFSLLNPHDMDSFLNNPDNPENSLNKICQTDSDKIILFTLMDQLIERAAKLTAAQLSAVVLKTGKGNNPARPVCIAADGTTYYKTRNLKFRTEFYLKQYLEDTKNRYIEFCHIDNAPVLGAAAAGLLQREIS